MDDSERVSLPWYNTGYDTFIQLLTLIGKFPRFELNRLLENSSNRPFYNFGSKFSSKNLNWDSDFHSKLDSCGITRHGTGQFLENSSKIEHLVEKLYSKNSEAWYRPIFYKNWIGCHKKLMDEFFRNRSSLCPGNRNFEKYWMIFPEIRLCHTPLVLENSNSFFFHKSNVSVTIEFQVEKVVVEYLMTSWIFCWHEKWEILRTRHSHESINFWSWLKTG